MHAANGYGAIDGEGSVGDHSDQSSCSAVGQRFTAALAPEPCALPHNLSPETVGLLHNRPVAYGGYDRLDGEDDFGQRLYTSREDREREAESGLPVRVTTIIVRVTSQVRDSWYWLIGEWHVILILLPLAAFGVFLFLTQYQDFQRHKCYWLLRPTWKQCQR
jgi:hypothetical protein